MKATLANIPVGNYEGGGRGKEREREKDRERDKEKEREAVGSGHFSFDTQSSPSTHPAEEPPSERAPESSSTADSSESRSRDGTTTKEVRGTSDTCSPVVIWGEKQKTAHMNVVCRPDGRNASLHLLSSLHQPPQTPTCHRHIRTKKALHPRSSKPGLPR